jgi:outer membrane protein assembly factor BamB
MRAKLGRVSHGFYDCTCMTAIHVVVRPRPDHTPSRALSAISGFLDVVVDGVNLTARVGEAQALALLAELGQAVASLLVGRRDRALLQLYAELSAWELGIEVDGEDALLTLFRAGAVAEVAIHERRVALSGLRDALLRALADATSAVASRSLAAQLAAAQAALENVATSPHLPPAARSTARVAPRSAGGISLCTEFSLRAAARAAVIDPHVERADLHALLGRGELLVTARGKVATLSEVYPFLFAERLLCLSEEVLDAWQGSRALFRRFDAGGVRIGVRQNPGEETIALSVGSTRGQSRPASLTFPELNALALARVAARFSHALAEAFVKHDAAQAKNLRLTTLAKAALSLAQRVEETSLDDARENPDPESYRSFGAPRLRHELSGRWEHGGKMRFLPRWVAAIPNIDLRTTYLCGDRLIVGASRETACLDRTSGSVLWRVPTSRAAGVVTPEGLARLYPDGRLAMHELATGEVRFTAELVPRAGGGACGAVVHARGLPKLLVLVEGDQRITAVDLVSGDVRWRHTARRAGSFRLRRAGKLLLVTGDQSLTALDVSTGELVWRARDRLPFSGDLAIDHDSVFAVSGSRIAGPAKLHHLDPWTGAVRYSRDLDDRPAFGQPPLVTPSRVIVPTRDQRGSGARAFDRARGEMLWEHAPGLTSPTTAWLAVDELILANTASGTLLCLDALSGAVRYSQVFSRHVDADQPRRLEPVLRSGALFVPQHQVHVVRPRDGELIGTLPTDLIPDLLRVDERCDVYVGEESGHLAAFGAAPRLALVR